MRGIKHSSYLLRLLSAGAFILGLSACGSRIDSRGNLLDPDLLTEIKVGQHTREQIAEMLGSPSSVATFDKETWYYISNRTETIAFFEPEVRERQVLVLRFDDKGVLHDVKTLGLGDSRIIQPVDRETPTAGNTMGLIDGVIANFSRTQKQTQKKLQK
ncbi:MAG: hypothetical protein A3G18_11560 [Rhodospirillales bacterium RIFCSPLOWO2_12_FULL_58_28]|nr:MAG: hypothetical protein A3H92_10710 [Rhodospirillales bacterium RIFCSPLOWO2_02_FULL_58_16]OHC77817.1 MAG: hypothetical protein A3G18_11560 [Rhodospirillales bacterium RIFCSPLOWO2_12_FULL_58_28]